MLFLQNLRTFAYITYVKNNIDKRYAYYLKLISDFKLLGIVSRSPILDNILFNFFFAKNDLFNQIIGLHRIIYSILLFFK